MAELMRLRAFAARQALTYLGGMPAAQAYDWLNTHFADPNELLPKAIKRSTEQTWQALAMALDDQPSLGERLKNKFAPGVVKGMAVPLRVLIAERDAEFRRRCRDELTRLRLDGTVDAEWRQAVVESPAFTTPTEALEHSRTVIGEEVATLRRAGFTDLPQLIELELPNGGGSLLLHVFNSFLRATVADNPELSQFLSFNLLENISDQQSYALELLEEIRQRLPDEAEHEPVVPPGATAILRSLQDKRTFKDLLTRVEALPEAQRPPELVDHLGRLGMAVGQFPEAQRLFTASAEHQPEPRAQAEAHYNTYRAALEHHDWPAAQAALQQAANLDPERFEPFPLDRYTLKKILGAGGFGTVFLCHDDYLNTPVVIKALHQATLERDTQNIFREAQILQTLKHPEIVDIRHCDFADRGKTRPYIVMVHFDGMALDDYLAAHGCLDVGTVRRLAQKIAHGLQAAHAQNILHRDLKPANILVRKTADDWDVRIIDFGLAMKVEQIRDSVLASQLSGSLLADSAGGTYQYAAPEQMGLRSDSVGPYSDVYGFGKTLCDCLFLTVSPTLRDWQKLARQDQPLAELLSDCIEDDSKKRPGNFTAVLKALAAPDGEAEHRRQAEEHAAREAQEAEQRRQAEERERAAREVQQAEQRRQTAEQAALEAQQAEQRRQAEERERAAREAQQETARTLRLDRIFCDRLRDGSPGPKLVIIPAGRFLMGSPEDEAERSSDERQHEVEIAQPFALGQYPVTFDEYDQFCAATMWDQPSDSGWGRGRRPVINVRWKDALAYCAWLSEQTGQTYRLPTEAEWEYACRAGTTTPFYFGETLSADQANYNSGGGFFRSIAGFFKGKTTPVGEFPANAWGLYDMHGNVWEWTGSVYDENYGGAEQRCADANESGFRVVRGGSWDAFPNRLRSASRYRLTPVYRNSGRGFRISRSL